MIKRISRNLVFLKKLRELTNDFFRLRNPQTFIKMELFPRTVSGLAVIYCVKSVLIRSFFWAVFSCIRTKKSLYLDTFHAIFGQLTNFAKNCHLFCRFYFWFFMLNNFNGTDCSWTFRVGLSCLMCSASGYFEFGRISKWSMFTFSCPVFSACSYKCDLL